MGLLLALQLVFVLLLIFVFIPLPIYAGGKIAHLQHEKFTYGSCIWTGIATGIVAGLINSILQAVLKYVLSGSLLLYIGTILSIVISVLVLGFFLKRSYTANNKQVAIIFLSVVVLGAVFVIISYLVLFLLTGFNPFVFLKL